MVSHSDKTRTLDWRKLIVLAALETGPESPDLEVELRQ